MCAEFHKVSIGSASSITWALNGIIFLSQLGVLYLSLVHKDTDVNNKDPNNNKEEEPSNVEFSLFSLVLVVVSCSFLGFLFVHFLFCQFSSLPTPLFSLPFFGLMLLTVWLFVGFVMLSELVSVDSVATFLTTVKTRILSAKAIKHLRRLVTVHLFIQLAAIAFHFYLCYTGTTVDTVQFGSGVSSPIPNP